jgi:hypothetical protein
VPTRPHLRQTDVSKCVWQQRWRCLARTLPVHTLLVHTCTQHTMSHSSHTHDPDFYVHSGSLVSCVSDQVSFLIHRHPFTCILFRSHFTSYNQFKVPVAHSFETSSSTFISFPRFYSSPSPRCSD